MRLSLVLVAYRSSAVLPRCIGSFLRETARANLEPEVVVVEHSEDPAEVRAIGSLPVDQLLTRPNRGFAAGVNLAVANSSGELLLVANPDIEFLENSVERLVAARAGGFTVVGPQLFWDREATVHLPVPEDPAPRAEWQRIRRRRSAPAWERGLDGYCETLLRFWGASEPVEAPSLRGPALLVSREDFARLGPWDEGYFLYSEETEWLWRARRRGARLAVAGGARVHHAWGDATRHLEGREELEARSHRRFMARNYPPWWRMAQGGGEDGAAGVRAETVSGPRDAGGIEAGLWMLSPWPHLMPAAGWPGGSSVPAAVAALTVSGTWYLAAALRENGRWRIGGAWSWGTA